MPTSKMLTGVPIITSAKTWVSNLNSGGWVEFQDYNYMIYSEDDTCTDQLAVHKWITTLIPSATQIGREPCPGPKLEQWVEAAGFKNIIRRKVKLPIGPWPKDPELKNIGMLNLSQLLDGLDAFSFRLLCDVAGWTQTEVLLLLSQVRKDLKNPAIHMQYDL